MDENVALGIQCARGVNERCWATQYSTNPVQYRVEPFTNNSSWYLDQSLMGITASKIRSLATCYVNPDTVYDGTINISMFTLAGVWVQLEIGDHMNQFTLTPASGTNAATYGDSPWRIYVTNLQERYNVIEVQKQTTSAVYHVMHNAYTGHGFGHTYGEAYDAAVSNYHDSSDPVYSEVCQYCKITFFSNLVAQGGSGATTETGEDGNLEWIPVGGHTGIYNLNVAAVTTGRIVSVTTTNVIVTGTLIPNATGTYVPNGEDSWINGMADLDTDHSISVIAYGGEISWTRNGDVEGIYNPGPPWVSGTASAVYDIVTTVTTNWTEETPPCVGEYSGAHPSWGQGAWNCTYIGGTYYITESTNYPPESSPSWSKTGDNPEGQYTLFVGSTEMYRNVSAVIAEHIVGGDEGDKYPVYYSHTWNETNIFYECWLRKGTPSQSWSIAATNIEHRASFWAWPSKATCGTINYFNDEGLGLASNVWNVDAIGDWTDWTFDCPVIIDDYWTSELSTPPDITSEPMTPNESICSGFWVSEWLGIAEWHFQYCTDE